MSALKYYDTTTGTWKYFAQGVKGDKGDTGATGATGATGPANVLSVDQVTSGATASATITGTTPSQKLNLVLPKGDTGQGYTQKGAFSTSASYVPYDVVYSKGSTWSCKAATGPSNQTPDSNGTKWQYFALGLTPLGIYEIDTEYFLNQVVSNNGSTWICLIDGTINITPTVGTLNWGLLAEKGATGAQGPQGPAGLSGANAKFEAFLANVNGPVKAFPTAVTPSGYTLSTTAISSVTVTAASGNGTTITYTANNSFVVGQLISISGLGIASGSSLNLSNVTVASVIGAGPTYTGFTVTKNTVGTSSGTGIAFLQAASPNQTVVYAYDSSKFTFRGLTPTVIQNSNNTSYYRNNANMNPSDPTPALIFNQFWVEFDYYGENFDIRYNNNQASYAGYGQIWIWVDGVPTTEAALITTGGYVSSSYNTDRVLNVNFGTGATKQRRIRILFGGLDFGGIGIKNVTETIFPVNQQLLKVAFIDGSWFAGTNGGTTSTAVNLANQLAVQYGEMLNVDYYNLSIQSTGYVRGGNVDPILQTVTSAGNGDNWCSPARLDLITTIQPDLVVLLGTTNDDTFTGSSYRLGDHATYVYNGIASRAPNAKIIVFARQSNTNYSSALATNASVVYTAAKAHPSVIDAVNIYDEGWITGSMTTGSSSGTPGNGQVFIYTDDHPNAAGNKYYAIRMFDRTYDIIKKYSRS
jgi:hypothetical protein